MSLANPTRIVAGSYRSISDARAALVAALAGAGFNAATVAPDSPTPNAAWPQWQGTEYNGHLAVPPRYRFAVFVVLDAGDMETAVSAADEAEAKAAPALYPLASIEMCEPVQITFGEGTTMPGIRFRLATRA